MQPSPPFEFDSNSGPAEIGAQVLSTISTPDTGVKPSKTLTGQATLLTRYLTRLDLIDQYSVEQANTTKVVVTFLDKWQRTYDEMMEATKDITDETLKTETVKYVESWKTFLAMYMLFKHNTHGAI